MITVLQGYDHGQHNFCFWKKKEGEDYISMHSRRRDTYTASDSISHFSRKSYFGGGLFHKKRALHELKSPLALRWAAIQFLSMFFLH